MNTFAKLKDNKTLEILKYIPYISNPTEKMFKDYALNNGYKIVEYTTQPYEYSYCQYKDLSTKISQYWYPFEYQMIYDDCMIKCQNLLDTTAQSRGYDNIQSLISYSSDANKVYAAEAKAAKNWRSKVWTKLYDILNKLQNKEIINPKSWLEIENQLPQISWPNS